MAKLILVAAALAALVYTADVGPCFEDGSGVCVTWRLR